MKKQVLVSGGAGYIGSHVTVELIAAGYDVVVADNMSNCDFTCFEGVKKITGRDDIPFVQIDCCDQDAVMKLFSDYRIDAVIHFAAFKAVGESVAEPIMYYKNNLVSFLNILEAAKTHGGCNVLFSSPHSFVLHRVLHLRCRGRVGIAAIHLVPPVCLRVNGILFKYHRNRAVLTVPSRSLHDGNTGHWQSAQLQSPPQVVQRHVVQCY